MIELEGITKSFRMGEHEMTILHGIDLQIAAGEMVAIMGPSGSGKSTLMNILGCLDLPNGGRYRLDGTDVRDLPLERLRRAVGCAFEWHAAKPTVRARLPPCGTAPRRRPHSASVRGGPAHRRSCHIRKSAGAASPEQATRGKGSRKRRRRSTSGRLRSVWLLWSFAGCCLGQARVSLHCQCRFARFVPPPARNPRIGAGRGRPGMDSASDEGPRLCCGCRHSAARSRPDSRRHFGGEPITR